MSEWKTYKLGDLIEINKNSINKNYSFSEIEYIDTSSVTENRFEDVQKITIGDAPSRAKRIVKENDIIYSTVRPILRHYGIMKNPKPNTVASTGFAVLSSINIDPYFLYYYLTTDEIVYFLNSVAESNTTTYPAFNASLFNTIKVTVPSSIEEQKEIAQILTSIDDKIEINLQMNQTLEAMAQAIFKEWFVDFNFPGFDGELVDGLPKGWRMGIFEELTDIKTGKGLKRTEFKPDGIYPIIGANGELGRTDEYLLDDKLLLTGRVGTLGSINISYGKKWYSDNVLIMKPYKYFYFSYFNLKAIDMNSLNRVY